MNINVWTMDTFKIKETKIHLLAVRFPERLIALLLVIICSTIEFPVSSKSNTSVSSVRDKKKFTYTKYVSYADEFEANQRSNHERPQKRTYSTSSVISTINIFSLKEKNTNNNSVN